MKEALAARDRREKWEHSHRKDIRRLASLISANVSRAMHLAMDLQYYGAVRALTNPPIADLAKPETLTRLKALHPAPASPVTPIPTSDLPPPSNISEAEVLRAARPFNPSSAAVLNCLSSRLLRYIAYTSTSPIAGVTGLAVLTHLVRKLAKGDLPTPYFRFSLLPPYFQFHHVQKRSNLSLSHWPFVVWSPDSYLSLLACG